MEGDCELAGSCWPRAMAADAWVWPRHAHHPAALRHFERACLSMMECTMLLACTACACMTGHACHAVYMRSAMCLAKQMPLPAGSWAEH